MPSNKKRINLTVPDALYTRLQMYKEKNGFTNDATACLQLITLQLNSQDTSAILTDFIRSSSLEHLLQISNEGMSFTKEQIEKQR